MRDLRRDWIKWSKAERISALLILAVLTFAIPSLIVSNVVSVAAARGSSHIGRSL